MSQSLVSLIPETSDFYRSSKVKITTLIAVVISVLCWINLPASIVAKAVEFGPVVYTRSGPVRGEVLTTIARSLKYSSFRSIRYAEPPIGHLRFKPPVPARPWTDVFNATVEASACAQDDLITHEYTGSEDCLFLNVFTPLTEFNTKDVEGKAVMVWIHGGSFLYGNAKTSLYGADFLLEDDVILVTLNYRLGPLGFLSLNHPDATGNAGMKDQVLALKWVNENIEKFGGDPGRVTIFGNSAGGVSVDLHTLSERSKGLFHRVISISGSVFNPWAIHTLNETITQSLRVAIPIAGVTAITGEKADFLPYLYNATAYEIIHGASGYSTDVTPFRPTIEDPNVAGEEAFLIEDPAKKYKTGNFTKVPYITGYNAQETACMVSDEKLQPIIDGVNSLVAGLKELNRSLPLTSPALQRLVSTAENAMEALPAIVHQELVEASSFEYFSAGTDVKQRFLTDHSTEPVYYYQVSFNPPKTFNKLLYHRECRGTAHMDELSYIFYMPIIDLPLDEADAISKTRRRVVRLWTNFAKYGNPTPNGDADPLLNINWPASGSSGTHLEIGEELSVGTRPVDALTIYQQLMEGKTIAAPKFL